jgi:phosphoenolpyruvate synthase/pyruvate phosphate dikinase
VKKCRASIMNPRVVNYRKEHNIKSELKMGIIVQEMVMGDFSGVAFSINPVNGNRDQIYIEIVKGLGETLVSGKSTPDYMKFDKNSLALTEISNSKYQNFAEKLGKLTLEIEKTFKKPVDMEWTVKDGEMFVLQVRPVTAVNSKLVTRNSKLEEKTGSLKLEKQITAQHESLVECFKDIGHEYATELRDHDNDKHVRLKILNEITGIPCDQPVSFEAVDLAKNTKELQDFVSSHKENLFRLRMIPKDPSFPKLRKKGFHAEELLEWFKTLKIDPKMYIGNFLPYYTKLSWSGIFIVNKKGIFGEILPDHLAKLTETKISNIPTIIFSYDFSHLTLAEENSGARKFVQQTIESLQIRNEKTRIELVKSMDSKFAKGYIEGYFEILQILDGEIIISDYNQILGRIYKNFVVRPGKTLNNGPIAGISASSGKIKGRAIRLEGNISRKDIDLSKIIICEMATPEMLPILSKAGGVISEKGGVLSHTSITLREMGKPAIVNAGGVMKKVKTGDLITLDADNGIILI